MGKAHVATAPTAIAYTRKALAGLADVEPKRRREQVVKDIDSLAADPFPPGSKQLAGWLDNGRPVRRFPVGPYRVLYQVDPGPPSRIIVLDIENRKDVYR